MIFLPAELTVARRLAPAAVVAPGVKGGAGRGAVRGFGRAAMLACAVLMCARAGHLEFFE